tara:strand:- start:817 stop:1185 length:369 start_codon:yes stop_codon:yes gene_type:complete
MAFILKKKYKLPFEICRHINNFNDKELIEYTKLNKKILHMDLIYYIDELETYRMHEYYFVTLLSFLRNAKLFIPKFNDENQVYQISLKEKKINYHHYILYNDHVNNFLYQNRPYKIYYNLMI